MNIENLRRRFCRSRNKTPRREFEHGAGIADEVVTDIIESRKKSFEALLRTTEATSPMAVTYTAFLAMLDDLLRDIKEYGNDWEFEDEESDADAAA